MAYDAAARKLYLHGGRSGGQARDDLWFYDVASGEWRSLSPRGDGPSPRFGHNAAFDPDRRRLVIFGGQAGSSFFSDVWTYETDANSWLRLVEDGPAPRYGAGGALDAEAGTFYVSHGFTFQGRFDDTWALPLSESRWRDVSPSAGRPLKRCLLRSVWDPMAGAMLLFGGQSNSAPYHNDFWRFDPASGAWEEITADPRPSARHFYAADFDVAGGRLIVFGGQTAAGPADDLWAFSTGEGGWAKLSLPSGPSARNGHDAVYIPDRRSLLVFGGAGPSGDVDDLWELGLA
jgi:hypothetical protein